MTLTDEIRAALAPGHAATPGLIAGDNDDLVEQHALGAGTDPTIAAAVLMAITERHDPGVLLIERPQHMRRHPGQIAFPGGRVDPEDDGPVAAALREAEEEISLPREMVSIIGETDPYRTITGFCITPVIGIVPPDLPLVAQAAEVADLFEVPLAFLMDPANYHRQSATWEGRQRLYYELYWDDRRIWGATAGMLVNLVRRLGRPL